MGRFLFKPRLLSNMQVTNHSTQLKSIINSAIELTWQCFGIECVRVLRVAFSRETWSANRYVRTIVFQTNLKSCCNITVRKLYQICKISVYGINTGDLALMQYRVEAPHYCALIIKKVFTTDTDAIARKIAHAIIELLITSHLFPELQQTALQITSRCRETFMAMHTTRVLAND
jgi:hypothetical protein